MLPLPLPLAGEGRGEGAALSMTPHAPSPQPSPPAGGEGAAPAGFDGVDSPVNSAATNLLAGLRASFDTACAALAKDCAPNGRLDARRLDARQVSSFELAWGAADLLAAETVVGALTPSVSEAQRRLALVFAVEAIAAVLPRLEGLCIELGIDLAPVRAINDAPAWEALRRDAGGAAALEAAGRDVAAGDGEVGTVALDEPHALAQEAFRRFSADVVAPQAEAIHRHDLTVPETLLKPLREMGVFGLVDPRAVRRQRPRRPRRHAADGGRDRGLVRRLARGGRQPDHAAGDPEPRAARGRHATNRSRIGCRGSRPATRCARSRSPSPTTARTWRSLTLKGTRAPGGWRLNGAKTWCTFAGKAGVLMVVTRTDPDRSLGHKGLSLLLVEKPSYEAHEFEVQQPAGGKLDGPRDPDHRLPRHALVRPVVRGLLRAGRERRRRRGGPRQGLLLHDGGHGRRPHADGGASLRRDAGRTARGHPLQRGPQGVRRAAAGVSAHAGQARAHGRAPRRLPAARLRGGRPRGPAGKAAWRPAW